MPNRMSLLVVLALLAWFAGAASASSDARYQSIESIRAAALAVIPDHGVAGVSAEATVDASLRLPACPGPLKAHQGSVGTVEVGCIESGWRLYVPVRVQRLQPVVVMTRGIAAGQPIPAEAMHVEMRDAGRMALGGIADPAIAEGRVARRALVAGSVLAAQDLVSPRSIRRGDTVTLVSRTGGIEVRAQGRAMAEAGPRERISVENLASRRVVQGVVLDSGEVDVVR